IFDVHKKNLLDFPNIINKTKKIIIIDHHIISKDIINETIFNFINTNYSSVSEIIVDYAICNNYKINSIIATTLLAGIEIDTNNYNLNTKEGTFIACAHLLKSGADIILKQEILKENKDLYIKKQYFIKRSYMINNEMALCVLDHHIYDSKFLAILSDELLQFENVEVSFTIGYIGRKKVGISARSIGKFDVEKIMNQFNGGGHATNAACQIENSSIEKVKRMLLKNIKER
ncbi:MAG TPA: hypothetical protein GX747_04330, partial [Tenericutes bacterium]|nr:hypothetical protein [Mycoplasmatota bacterium]